MRNICLTISYLGSSFCGWQRQAGKPSVEEQLDRALFAVHHRSVPFWAAGRTDSGVHAEGQVVNFHSTLSMPAERFTLALNAHLPPAIRVLVSREVPAHFHARYSACGREYRYRILNQPGGDSQLYLRSWYVRSPLPLGPLNRCLRPLIGEHDFTTFAAAGSQSPHNVRRIHAASVFPEGNCLSFRIIGNAFLWHMVRSLVGTCVDLVKCDEGERMGEILHARQRQRAGQTAPARGLTLTRVLYPAEVL